MYAAIAALGLLQALQGAPHYGEADFFQEYASARNWWLDRPVYGPLRDVRREYLPTKFEPPATYFVEVNAHPPVAVLLVLPLGLLSFTLAFRVWTVISLAALGLGFCWLIRRWEQPPQILTLGAVVLGLSLSIPFQEQMGHGQLNAVLLALMLGAWQAWRSDRPTLVGLALGTATALKLFPGFLFLPLLIDRQWRAITTGLITFVVLNVLAGCVLGFDTLQAYVSDVLPQVHEWRGAWGNASLGGFWHKAFDPGVKGGAAAPLWVSPTVAKLAALISIGIVTGLTMWRHWQRRGLNDRDGDFALATTAMLLVSPTTWSHYLLLLTLPLAVMWTRLPRTWSARVAFGVWLVALGMNPLWPWFTYLGPGPRDPTTIELLTLLSLQTYLLLGQWLWQWRACAVSKS